MEPFSRAAQMSRAGARLYPDSHSCPVLSAPLGGGEAGKAAEAAAENGVRGVAAMAGDLGDLQIRGAQKGGSGIHFDVFDELLRCLVACVQHLFAKMLTAHTCFSCQLEDGDTVAELVTAECRELPKPVIFSRLLHSHHELYEIEQVSIFNTAMACREAFLSSRSVSSFASKRFNAILTAA